MIFMIVGHYPRELSRTWFALNIISVNSVTNENEMSQGNRSFQFTTRNVFISDIPWCVCLIFVLLFTNHRIKRRIMASLYKRFHVLNLHTNYNVKIKCLFFPVSYRIRLFDTFTQF